MNASSLIKKGTFRARTHNERTRSLYSWGRVAAAPVTARRRRAAARAERDKAAFSIPEEQGWTRFDPGVFEEGQEVVEHARAALDAADLDVSTATTGKARRGFMRSLLDSSEVSRDTPLVRFALREDVLAAVAEYLHTAPVLAHIDVFYSGSAPGSPSSSQLLHCDQDATRQIKAFLLCSEVSEENGPLKVMGAEESRALRRTLRHHFRNRVPDEEAERAIGRPPEFVSMVGEPGTVCLADTSRCFHYGSRVEEEAEPRLVAMVQWHGPFSFKMPRNVDRSGGPYRHLARPDDSRLVQLALAGGVNGD